MADERFCLLSVPIDPVTMDVAVQRCGEFIVQGGAHHVLTADALGIWQANNDPELLEIMRCTDLSTPDGAGVMLCASFNGIALPARVSGVDLVKELADLAAKKGYKIFLFGAAEGVAQAAAENLVKEFPALQIAGTKNGFYDKENEQSIAEEIAKSGADILFVALGIPRQEKFISTYRDTLNIPVMAGIGGSFDVISGKIARAPKIFQKMGLEWLYRAMKEPRVRFKRMQGLPQLIILAWEQRKRD